MIEELGSTARSYGSGSLTVSPIRVGAGPSASENKSGLNPLISCGRRSRASFPLGRSRFFDIAGVWSDAAYPGLSIGVAELFEEYDGYLADLGE